MELWDAYDENFNKIEGVTLVRGNPVPDGLFHLVCNVLVRHTDGSYLLMQRDFDKHFGGLWQATAGGSALQGETPLQCVARELLEETGVTSQNLTEAGRDVNFSRRTLFVNYLCTTDCDKNSVTLQQGETVAYRWVSEEQLLSMRDDPLVVRCVQSYLHILRPKN